MSGQPHDDRGSERPDSEFDPERGTPVPGWELDDQDDATIDLPAVALPEDSGAEEDTYGQAPYYEESYEDEGDVADEDGFVPEPYAEPEDATADITAAAAPAASGRRAAEAEPLPMRPRGHGRRSAKPAKKSHTLLWAVLAGLLVVIIAVALILFFTLRHEDPKPQGGATVESLPTKVQDGTPAAAVRDLGQAMKDGKAEDALELLDVSALQGDAHPLLVDKVYSKAKARPSALTPAAASLGTPAEDALSAGVSATLDQSGKKTELSLRVTRTESDAPWKVAIASLPALEVSDSGGAKVKVNGTDVKLPGDSGDYSTHRIFALPGTYSLKRSDSKFVDYPKTRNFTSPGTALDADPESGIRDLGSLSLQGKHNKAFGKESKKVVNEWLDECIASNELAPKNCPNGADGEGETVTDIKWTLDERPELSFPDSGVETATVEGKSGRASVEGKVKQDGQDATLEADNVPIEFSGTLKISGNKIQFSYDG